VQAPALDRVLRPVLHPALILVLRPASSPALALVRLRAPRPVLFRRRRQAARPVAFPARLPALILVPRLVLALAPRQVQAPAQSLLQRLPKPLSRAVLPVPFAHRTINAAQLRAAALREFAIKVLGGCSSSRRKSWYQ
jgi:hypothetical protein